MPLVCNSGMTVTIKVLANPNATFTAIPRSSGTGPAPGMTFNSWPEISARLSSVFGFTEDALKTMKWDLDASRAADSGPFETSFDVLREFGFQIA